MRHFTNRKPGDADTGNTRIPPGSKDGIEPLRSNILCNHLGPLMVAAIHVCQGQTHMHRRGLSKLLRKTDVQAPFSWPRSGPHLTAIFKIREQRQVALIYTNQMIS